MERQENNQPATGLVGGMGTDRGASSSHFLVWLGSQQVVEAWEGPEEEK